MNNTEAAIIAIAEETAKELTRQAEEADRKLQELISPLWENSEGLL